MAGQYCSECTRLSASVPCSARSAGRWPPGPGLTPLGYLAGVAAAAVGIAAFGSTRLLPADADRAPTVAPRDPGQRATRRGIGWSPFVIGLGLLGAGCLLAEGAAQSWAAVFLRDQRHASATLAASAYLVFTAVQVVGRLPGDRLHQYLGPVRLVQAGALIAGAGLCLELLPASSAAAICGVGIYSLGLSVLVPIIFSAVGHGSAERHDSASVTEAVAKFTTISYLGYLLGPASIGWLAQGVGLTWALASVFIVLAAVLVCSRLAASARPGHDDTADGESALAQGEAATS